VASCAKFSRQMLQASEVLGLTRDALPTISSGVEDSVVLNQVVTVSIFPCMGMSDGSVKTDVCERGLVYCGVAEETNAGEANAGEVNNRGDDSEPNGALGATGIDEEEKKDGPVKNGACCCANHARYAPTRFAGMAGEACDRPCDAASRVAAI